MSERGPGHDARALVLAADPSQDEERQVTVFGLANTFIRNWLLFLALPVLGGLAAAAFSMSQPREYGASASFVSASASETSQYAGLAQQFGMRLGSSDAGRSPDFYGALLTTRGILTEVVETEYAVETGEGVKRGTLVHFYEFDRPDAKLPVGRTPLQASVEKLRESMGVSVDWETGIVRLSARTEWPQLSELIVGRIVELTQAFDLEKRRTQGTARRQFAEERYKEGKQALERAEARLEQFVSRNRLFSQSPLLLLEYTNLQQELFLRHQVYAALVQNFEQARIEEVRNTPVITVLEHADGTAYPLSRKTALKVLVGFIFGLAIALAIALLRGALRFARARRSSEYEEFVELRRQLRHDIGRLRPWGRRRETVGSGD